MSTSNNTPFKRVLVWDDVILDLQDALAQSETPMFIVGGAVRDAFMRRPVKDVDLATPGSGIKLARKIANALKGDFYPLDDERDVGRALVDTPQGRVNFDVASFRGADLHADLNDRDFTINAMAVDLFGDLNDLIDPMGGERDLISKIIRRCNPHALSDDPIRALRAVRQSVKFGFRIDPDTLKDIRAVAERLKENSPERLRDEFFQLFDLAKPDTALRVADTLGLLEKIVPEIEQLRSVQGESLASNRVNLIFSAVDILNQMLTTISPRRTDETAAQFTLGTLVVALDRYRKSLQDLLHVEYANQRTHSALLFLALLLSQTSMKMFEERALALRLSNPERERLVAIARQRTRFESVLRQEMNPLTIYQYWRDTGAAGVDVILLSLTLHLAEQGMLLDQDDWLTRIETARILLHAYFEQRDELIEPPSIIDGRGLMSELELKPGKQIGELLEAIRELQVQGMIRSYDDAVNFARQRISQNGSHRG